MYYSMDFGGSTVDVIFWECRELVQFPIHVRSFERKSFSFQKDPFSLLRKSGLSFDRCEKIFITGGKSRFFPDQYRNIPLVKIPEIEAIGRGGYYLLHQGKKMRKFYNSQKILVVSMGTGTCMVEVEQEKNGYLKSTHVGGTGVGGGTFLGLSRALLHQGDIANLKKLFERGKRNNVDLSVAEIIGSGIGKVPKTATASNLAKLASEIDFSKSDIASGIVHLIGQTIGILSVFAAKAYGCKLILLTGKLTEIQKIVDSVLEVGKIYQIPMAVPKNAGYVAALGAGYSIKN